MPIIIKEMVVKTTVEKSVAPPMVDAASVKQLKTALVQDLTRAQERKNNWKKER